MPWTAYDEAMYQSALHRAGTLTQRQISEAVDSLIRKGLFVQNRQGQVRANLPSQDLNELLAITTTLSPAEQAVMVQYMKGCEE